MGRDRAPRRYSKFLFLTRVSIYVDSFSGRTQKGCVVMLDKEKKKIREAMAAEGKELLPFKAKSTPKVRDSFHFATTSIC